MGSALAPCGPASALAPRTQAPWALRLLHPHGPRPALTPAFDFSDAIILGPLPLHWRLFQRWRTGEGALRPPLYKPGESRLDRVANLTGHDSNTLDHASAVVGMLQSAALGPRAFYDLFIFMVARPLTSLQPSARGELGRGAPQDTAVLRHGLPPPARIPAGKPHRDGAVLGMMRSTALGPHGPSTSHSPRRACALPRPLAAFVRHCLRLGGSSLEALRTSPCR